MKGGKNKMNKIYTIGLIAMFAMAMFSVSLVLAEENTSVAEPMLISEQVNVSTDDVEADLGLNESVSDSEVAWKSFKLWFIFNQEKKINAELDLARLRLAQANRAAERNDTEDMEKAMEKHERIMNKIQEQMDKFEIGSDVNDSANKLLGLENAIGRHEQRIAFLNYVFANANLTEEQRAKIEERMARVENVTARLNEVQQEKQDRITTRLMAEGNLTEEQAKRVLEIMRPLKDDREEEREANKQAMERAREEMKQAREISREENKQIRERMQRNGSWQDDDSEDETEDDSDDDSTDLEDDSDDNSSGNSLSNSNN
jgi:hypothetical protein